MIAHQIIVKQSTTMIAVLLFNIFFNDLGEEVERMFSLIADIKLDGIVNLEIKVQPILISYKKQLKVRK